MGRMNRNKTANRQNAALVPASLALAVILGAAGGESGAYFTAYHTACWEQGLRLGAETEIAEEYGEGRKTVVIENTGGTECFVRVKAFAGSRVSLSFAGSGWSEGADGYWYYDGILKPGEGTMRGDKTEPLYITVGLPELSGGEDFAQLVQNVAVVQECAQAFYRDHDGEEEPYAEWTLSIIEEGEG